MLFRQKLEKPWEGLRVSIAHPTHPFSKSEVIPLTGARLLLGTYAAQW